mmetsp:Transcript_33746/g.79887  ORF Transcript_33746/g.79887 Transcript_33746/m.79887 type:complete len:309 (+) Transcript_33746:773-1699(+)
MHQPPAPGPHARKLDPAGEREPLEAPDGERRVLDIGGLVHLEPAQARLPHGDAQSARGGNERGEYHRLGPSGTHHAPLQGHHTPRAAATVPRTGQAWPPGGTDRAGRARLPQQHDRRGVSEQLIGAVPRGLRGVWRTCVRRLQSHQGHSGVQLLAVAAVPLAQAVHIRAPSRPPAAPGVGVAPHPRDGLRALPRPLRERVLRVPRAVDARHRYHQGRGAVPGGGEPLESLRGGRVPLRLGVPGEHVGALRQVRERLRRTRPLLVPRTRRRGRGLRRAAGAGASDCARYPRGRARMLRHLRRTSVPRPR